MPEFVRKRLKVHLVHGEILVGDLVEIRGKREIGEEDLDFLKRGCRDHVEARPVSVIRAAPPMLARIVGELQKSPHRVGNRAPVLIGDTGRGGLFRIRVPAIVLDDVPQVGIDSFRHPHRFHGTPPREVRRVTLEGVPEKPAVFAAVIIEVAVKLSTAMRKRVLLRVEKVAHCRSKSGVIIYDEARQLHQALLIDKVVTGVVLPENKPKPAG